MMEAMKWEKRMELAYNYMGAWFFDSRGWGDLVKDTPLHYPVPVPCWRYHQRYFSFSATERKVPKERSPDARRPSVFFSVESAVSRV